MECTSNKLNFLIGLIGTMLKPVIMLGNISSCTEFRYFYPKRSTGKTARQYMTGFYRYAFRLEIKTADQQGEWSFLTVYSLC